MYRDKSNSTSTGSADLSVRNKLSVEIVLGFIENNIQGFRPYYLNSTAARRENTITFYLAQYLNSMAVDEQDGMLPYLFYQHPATDTDEQEPDLAVVATDKQKAGDAIFILEAKRLSTNITSSHQYVYGQSRGGMERFKKCLHGQNSNVSGIVGYVQTDNCNYWLERINIWVNTQIIGNTDALISWDEQDIVQNQDSTERYLKGISNSLRNNTTRIILHHYLIDLLL